MKVTVSGRFAAETKTFGAGTWSSAREAGIAYDRVVLFLGLDKPLNFPKESKGLGPASPDEMKLAARVNTLAKAKAKLRNGFAGVRRTGAGNYMASPTVGVRAGVWECAEDAALARDRVVLHLGLAQALNFPDKAGALGPASAEQMRQAAARLTRDPHQFRGVSSQRSGAWSARLLVRGERYHVGTFSSAEEAARAYDKAAWNLTGDAGILNFAPPDHAPSGKPPARTAPRIKTAKWLGVSKTTSGSFMGVITRDDRPIHLGAWATGQQAAVARDRAALFFDENTSKLNFPDHSRSLGPLSPKELMALSRATNPRSASGYQGIGYYENADSWFTCVVADGRSHKVGTFDSAEEAARARDRLWLHHGLDRSFLNFPDEDLKPASAKELQAEVRRAFKETTSSQYRGVWHDAKKGQWIAQIKAGRHHFLGTFDSEIEAARVYDEAALRLHEQPVLNFPEGQAKRARRKR